MGDILLRQMSNRDKDFYKIMGPFLSRREIVAELGNSVWDDDGKDWFVAIDKGAVLGFVAAVLAHGKVQFCSDYVLPEHRNSGVYDRIFEARLAAYPSEEIAATVTPMSLPCYEAHGFIKTGMRGKYIVVKREVSHE